MLDTVVEEMQGDLIRMRQTAAQVRYNAAVVLAQRYPHWCHCACRSEPDILTPAALWLALGTLIHAEHIIILCKPSASCTACAFVPWRRPLP